MTTVQAAQAFAPTMAPRGAQWAADLALYVVRAVGALRFYVSASPALRAIEAGAVRQRAAEHALRGNTAFAADLFAAADRHERRG